jgi:hypothetical protein
MINLPEELEQQVITHETIRNDAAGAQEVLETLLLLQVRAIADGLLADILLRGESFSARSWWYQFLSRQQQPSQYLPDLADAAFRSYRKEFAQRVGTNRIKRISLGSLPESQVRIFGGHCCFHEEGRINRQLARLGSSLRLIVVGSALYRIARVRSMFGKQANDKTSLDGRFILGRIGPVSVFGRAALYLFEREFAISPYMEAEASGFTDEAKIVVRQDILRGEVEDQIQKFLTENAQAASGDEATEEPIPFTVAQGMVRKALKRGGDSPPSREELLHQITNGVLTHEAAHILYSGARFSHGTSNMTAWRQVVREDLLRFAQQPHTLDEIRTAFADYFPEGDLMSRVGPAFEMLNHEDGYTIKEELKALRSDGLLFVDRDNRYYSRLYGRGEPWTL